MGLTIRSSHKQELSLVYQFIDVLYSLCIYEALRHWSLSCSLLRVFSVLSSCSLWRSRLLLIYPALYLCRAIYTKLVALWLAMIGRCYYWSHTSGRSVRLYTGECVVDSSTGLWDRARCLAFAWFETIHLQKKLIAINLCATQCPWWAILFPFFLSTAATLQCYQYSYLTSKILLRYAAGCKFIYIPFYKKRSNKI